MAKYVFSKKKFIENHDKKDFLKHRGWLKEVQGIIFEAELYFSSAFVRGYLVCENWCTRPDKTNYKKNF